MREKSDEEKNPRFMGGKWARIFVGLFYNLWLFGKLDNLKLQIVEVIAFNVAINKNFTFNLDLLRLMRPTA